jgi:hypothetical protein
MRSHFSCAFNHLMALDEFDPRPGDWFHPVIAQGDH